MIYGQMNSAINPMNLSPYGGMQYPSPYGHVGEYNPSINYLSSGPSPGNNYTSATPTPFPSLIPGIFNPGTTFPFPVPVPQLPQTNFPFEPNFPLNPWQPPTQQPEEPQVETPVVKPDSIETTTPPNTDKSPINPYSGVPQFTSLLNYLISGPSPGNNYTSATPIPFPSSIPGIFTPGSSYPF